MSSPDMSVVWIPPGAPVWVPSEAEQKPPAAEPVPSPQISPLLGNALQPPAAPHRLPDLPRQVPDGALAGLMERQKPTKTKKKKKGSGRPTPTKEMISLAQGALEYWGVKPGEMEVAAAKPWRGSAIWRTRTSAGVVGFKMLERSLRRSLFSVGAQDYLVKQGALVPALVPTKGGDLHAVERGRVFVMTKWIDGLVPAPRDAEGAAALSYGLGQFHRLSKGYRPPEGALHASRLHKWMDAYAKMRSKFDWVRALAIAYPEMPAAGALRGVVDHFIRQADEALDRLERSAYHQLVSKGGPYWGLVHQDYGWGNGQLGPGGVWVIDLDSTCYDLPVRDLRKLITQAMDEGKWEVSWIEQMLRAYNDAHPMDGDLLELLLIDLVMPNEFYRLVRPAASNPLLLDTELKQDLEQLMVQDEAKGRALRIMGLRGR